MQVQNSKTLVIASGGTTSTSLELEAFYMMGIQVPTIDSATLKIQGSFDGSTFADIYDSTGTQQLLWTASTGGRCWSSRDLEHCRGYKFIQIVAGAAQNGGVRTFNVVQKLPFPR